MKNALMYFPVVLSLVLLGAHFLRYGQLVGVAGSLLLIALLAIARPWVARLLQVALVLGSLEWVRTIYELVQMRIAHGQPFTRMAVILGVVTIITFGSALLFQTPRFRKRYRL